MACTDCLYFTGEDYMRTKVKSNLSENTVFQFLSNMMIVLYKHFTCYVYSFLWLTNLKVLMRVRKFLQESSQRVIPTKKKNSVHGSFFICSQEFVSDISGVLEVRHYNRGLLIHKFMFEALWRLYQDEFVKWITIRIVNDVN